jgi:hypothetical protein
LGRRFSLRERRPLVQQGNGAIVLLQKAFDGDAKVVIAGTMRAQSLRTFVRREVGDERENFANSLPAFGRHVSWEILTQVIAGCTPKFRERYN